MVFVGWRARVWCREETILAASSNRLVAHYEYGVTTADVVKLRVFATEALMVQLVSVSSAACMRVAPMSLCDTGISGSRRSTHH